MLRGALGPSDGSVGAACNVPSALGVLRHAEIYRGLPEEIEEAFGVLEKHVIRDGQLYPVALAAVPFLFGTLRAGSPVGERMADLIAYYAASANTLESPLGERFVQIIVDHAGDLVRWFGRYDRALAALVVHLPALRPMYLAAVEGAERVSAHVLLALVELGSAAGESLELALMMLDGAHSSNVERMAAAAFLARFAEPDTDLVARIDAALPPSAPGALRNFVGKLWTPTLVRPSIAPELVDAEVMFTGKKLVLVKAGTRSVTLPWVGADVARGDRLKVGLTAHGQPKLVVVTDWRGNVRLIDF